jgi:DNA-binding NtrC family response regulator
MTAELPWLKKLRVASGINDAALVLSHAMGETAHAEKSAVFLLDYTRANLLFFASWSMETGAMLEGKQAVSSFNLEDPLCLALQKGEAYTISIQSGMSGYPSLALLDVEEAVGNTLRIYPLLAWSNVTIGGVVLHCRDDVSVFHQGMEVLCIYGALLMASFEQRNHDDMRIASLHNDLSRLETCRPVEMTVGSLLIGQSPVMQKVREQIALVAPHKVSVLVTGETGTGKELAAMAIHAASPRNKAPFVRINCGALPAQLLESELFGHKKGAFSGAQSDHPGLLRSADGGTVLLDEIGEMPMDLQVKLLLVLQDYQVRPVGDVQSYIVDIRIVSATNRDMEEAVNKGTFRKDLYYRLAGYHIHIPPLRTRREDIPHLSMFFFEKYRDIYKANNITILYNEMIELCSYEYPGNIRELESIIENMIIAKSKKNINDEDEKYELYSGNDIMTLSEYVDSYERAIITSAIMHNNGNITNAAKLLGVPRTSLIAKIKTSEKKRKKSEM